MMPPFACLLSLIASITRASDGLPATGTITLAGTLKAWLIGLPPGRSPASMTEQKPAVCSTMFSFFYLCG
jgi:hypothetical protein